MAPIVLVLGSSGMAGHLVAQYFREKGGLQIIDVGPRRAVFPESILSDLEDPEALRQLLGKYKPNYVINCTGVLVKASEERKREAVWFNAYLPQLLSTECRKCGAKLIHLSTDCVFSGNMGPYLEQSFRDGDDYYGRAKALGEVAEGGDITIRTSIIGPELRSDGTGFFHWFMNQSTEVRGYRKALWSGVTTLELAKFLYFVLTKKPELSGLVHYAVAGGISKYELLKMIGEVFNRNVIIRPVDEPVIDKRLIGSRIDIGMRPSSYLAQIGELAQWMQTHPELYKQYNG